MCHVTTTEGCSTACAVLKELFGVCLVMVRSLLGELFGGFCGKRIDLLSLSRFAVVTHFSKIAPNRWTEKLTSII